MSNRFAEKLTILNEHGLGLCHRLAFIYQTFVAHRPTWITEFKKLFEPSSPLVRKFPDIDPAVDRLKEWQDFRTRAKDIMPFLEPFYNYFLDTMEFRDNAILVLNEIGTESVEMKLETNPNVLFNFLNLFRLYVQLAFLIHQIEDRRVILTTYSKLFQAEKGQTENSYSRVSSWVHQFETPSGVVNSLREDLKQINNSIGSVLVNLQSINRKVQNVSQLRKEGLLNLALDPTKMEKPSTHKEYFQFVHSEAISFWLTFGFLIFPDAAVLPGGLDMVKLILGNGVCFPIFNGISVQLGQEYVSVYENHKNKSYKQIATQKKFKIKDVTNEAPKEAVLRHKERRIWIRQELRTFRDICFDTPALMCPKFPALVCAMGIAKEEIFWYCRHTSFFKDPRNLKKAKIDEEKFKDELKITELIHILQTFKSFALQHKKMIQQYYLEYLGGADLEALTALMTTDLKASIGEGAFSVLESIKTEISTLSGIDHDFRTLRLNWLRVECSLSSIKSTTSLMKVQNLIDRLNLITWHTRYIDEIDTIVDQMGSLRELWYYKEIVRELFQHAISRPSPSPYYVSSFLQICSEFPANATSYNPEERTLIGKESVTYFEESVDLITKRISNLFFGNKQSGPLVHSWESWNALCTDPSNAALFQYKTVLEGQNNKKKQQALKIPKNVEYEQLRFPGEESTYRNRRLLVESQASGYIENLRDLLSALNVFETIKIYNVEFCPREILRTKLQNGLKRWLRYVISQEMPSQSKQPEKRMERPSVLYQRVQACFNLLRSLEDYVDFDIDGLLRSVMVDQVYLEALGEMGSFSYITADESQYHITEKAIEDIHHHFEDFVQKLAAPPAKGETSPNVVYCPNRCGFFSKPSKDTQLPNAFKAEHYFSLPELTALCRLIGGYGVKLLDRCIFKAILGIVQKIKQHIMAHKTELGELQSHYNDEETLNKNKVWLKISANPSPEAFLHLCVSLGNLVSLHRLLRTAHSVVLRETLPLVQNTSEIAFKQYKSNIFMDPNFVPSDLMAAESGIAVVTESDQALKKFLAKSLGSGDAGIWDTLPIMLASLFHPGVSFWRGTTYEPNLSAPANGAGVLPVAFETLIVAFKSLTATEPSPQLVAKHLLTFMDLGSVFLLRMAKEIRAKHLPIDISSLAVLLDTVATESTLVSRTQLDSILSYSILRNEWRQIFNERARTNRPEVNW